MKLGRPEEPSSDMVMSDPSILSLKRARSPPKLSKSSPTWTSPTEPPLLTTVPVPSQVSPFPLSLVGELGGDFSELLPSQESMPFMETCVVGSLPLAKVILLK